MLGFLRNFWVCLFFTLLCAWLAAISYTDGHTGWALFNAGIALMWLNDARKAKNRDKEASDEQEKGTKDR